MQEGCFEDQRTEILWQAGGPCWLRGVEAELMDVLVSSMLIPKSGIIANALGAIAICRGAWVATARWSRSRELSR
jgi:hypothetical protein